MLCRLFAAHVDGAEDGHDVGDLGPSEDVGKYTSIFRTEPIAEVFAFLQRAAGKIDRHIQRSAKKIRPEPACDGLEIICGPEEININRRNSEKLHSESGSFSGALKNTTNCNPLEESTIMRSGLQRLGFNQSPSELDRAHRPSSGSDPWCCSAGGSSRAPPAGRCGPACRDWCARGHRSH